MRVLMTILFIFLLGLLGGFDAYTEARRTQAASNSERMTSVKIGFESEIFGSVDPKDAQAVLDLYIKGFAKSLQVETEAIIYSSIDSIVSDLSANRLDMVCCSVTNYYQISKQVETELAYTNTNNGRKFRQSILLVHRDSGFEKIEDLKDKNLLMKTSDPISQMFVNTILLRHNQSPADQHFSNIINKRKPSKMVLDIFFRKNDACLIDNWSFDAMVELNPQIEKQLKVIAISPHLVPSVTFFRKNVIEKLKTEMKDIALKTAKSTYGQQLLILFKSDNIDRLRPADLDSYEHLRNEYEARMQHWEDQINAQ